MTRAAANFPASGRPSEARPPSSTKGRGARSNASGRFEPLAHESVDDGWGNDDLPPLKTDVTVETPRTIINYIDSPFVGFDRSINPYRGCEHGCIYCFARPTHAYYGLSPGLDFESRLFAKPNAAALLERELNSRSYKLRHIAIGTNTDPYQPIERRFELMRGILQTLVKFRHPVSILTKSALISRDIDLLQPLAKMSLVKTMLSVTTLDGLLARAMEPRASSPLKRLSAIRDLRDAGIPVGVMTAPLIPGLNDHELEDLLSAAKDAGAQWAGYTVIRLPLEVAGLFREWLASAFPDRAQRIMRHIRDMNGGRDYDVQRSRSATPRSIFAKLLSDRFNKAISRIGLSDRGPPLDHSLFRRLESAEAQLSLF